MKFSPDSIRSTGKTNVYRRDMMISKCSVICKEETSTEIITK